MTALADTLFYSLEKAIKSYRQFAQLNIDRAGLDVTIDQWLILKSLQENPDIALQQVAKNVFKDVASVTRIIQLLEGKGFIARTAHPKDGRRFALSLTVAGRRAIRAAQPIIARNRAQALKGLRANELKVARTVLTGITSNCRRGAGE